MDELSFERQKQFFKLYEEHVHRQMNFARLLVILSVGCITFVATSPVILGINSWLIKGILFAHMISLYCGISYLSSMAYEPLYYALDIGKEMIKPQSMDDILPETLKVKLRKLKLGKRRSNIQRYYHMQTICFFASFSFFAFWIFLWEAPISSPPSASPKP